MHHCSLYLCFIVCSVFLSVSTLRMLSFDLLVVSCLFFCAQGGCANCIHAVVKYNSSDASFTLHDIGSMLGVYVNDCRVRNTAVQLEHNDVIRFGYAGLPYEFLLECQPMVGRPTALFCFAVMMTWRQNKVA